MGQTEKRGLYGGNAVSAVNVRAIEDKRRLSPLEMLQEGFRRPKSTTGRALQSVEKLQSWTMGEKAGDGLVGNALYLLGRRVRVHVAQLPTFDGGLGPDPPLMSHIKNLTEIIDRELFIDLGQFGDAAIARTK